MDAYTLLWSCGLALLLFFVGVGTALVLTLTDSTSIGFIIAQVFFVAAALDIVAFGIYWIMALAPSLAKKAMAGAVLGGLVVSILVMSLVWITTAVEKVATYLIPANLPTPPLPSSLINPSPLPPMVAAIMGQNSDQIPPNALKVFLGSNLAWATVMPHTIITMGGQPILVIDRRHKSNDLVVKTLRIFDDRQNIIVRIDNDGFWVDGSSRMIRPDPSTLIIFDHTDSEVLRIALVNQDTLVVTGIFRQTNVSQPIIITPTSMSINGFQMSDGVLGGGQGTDINAN